MEQTVADLFWNSAHKSGRLCLTFVKVTYLLIYKDYIALGDFGNNKSFIISDETVLMELRPWQREVLKFSKEIIGTVKTSLVGDRSEESTLGNFVTDAIVNYVST